MRFFAILLFLARIIIAGCHPDPHTMAGTCYIGRFGTVNKFSFLKEGLPS